jgi:hypothetical protein
MHFPDRRMLPSALEVLRVVGELQQTARALLVRFGEERQRN